jgi:hypothetical protein
MMRSPLFALCRPAEQDKIARAMLRLTGTDDETPVALSADERAAIAASKAAAARGEFASDAQVRATRSASAGRGVAKLHKPCLAHGDGANHTRHPSFSA